MNDAAEMKVRTTTDVMCTVFGNMLVFNFPMVEFSIGSGGQHIVPALMYVHYFIANPLIAEKFQFGPEWWTD